MNVSEVVKYGEVDGNAKLEFEDESCLVLIPYREEGHIGGFDSALLYQNGTLEALYTNKPSKNPAPEEKGFWTEGDVSPQELAGYLCAARDIGEQVYRDWRAEKIDQNVWDKKFWVFWLITLECQVVLQKLAGGEVRVLDQKPSRHKDRI